MRLSGYQEESVARLIEPHKPTPTYGCFDVPGAGKTATAINAHLRLDRFPALITMPSHLILQWRDELIRWGIPPEEIGYCPRGMKPRERLLHLSEDRAFQLVSYNMWTHPTYRDLLLNYGWGSYSFDESHRLRKGRKGRGGLWTPISHLRTKTRSKHMQTPLWLFSGTPIVKSADDVFPLVHLRNPYRFTSRQDFAMQWCRVSQTPYGMHVGPVRDPDEFYRFLGQYSIRRNWKQIPELAGLKKRDIPVPIELDPVDLRRHRVIKQEYRDPLTGEALYSSSAMIHALRRLTISAKVEAFTDMLEDHSGRFICLVWYKDSGRMAYDRIKQSLRGSTARNAQHVVYIDGTSTERERQHALHVYHTHSDAILVGTLGALETGLNLQTGYQVAFLEQHWLSTTNEQAVARVLRRGQTQPVLVFWLHCPKSYDMRVKRVSETRGADIERALNDFIEEEEWE